MLVAVLHRRDLTGNWSAEPNGWACGPSSIRPYRNAVLHAEALSAPGRLAVIIRERVHGVPASTGGFAVTPCSDEAMDRRLATVARWPLDHLVLTISRSDESALVRLRCGHWGTAPVYLVATGETLRIDWDPVNLYAHLPSAEVDPAAAAEFIAHLDYPYSRRTLFPGMMRLTERASADWQPGQSRVRIKYPSPAGFYTADRLVRGADVPGAFREILLASMRRWTGAEDGAIAVECSGGLDSSVVAAGAAAIARQPVKSFGLLMPGTPGGHQRVRRAALVRQCGLIDQTLPCIEHAPFVAASRRVREFAFTAWEEYYGEAVGAMLDLATAAGASAIFTGSGGDELGTLQRNELRGHGTQPASVAQKPPLPDFASAVLREAYATRDRHLDYAPSARLHTSALEAAKSASVGYLRAGVWPISPLCTPELVDFCRRLPLAWRHRRRIHRRVLASFGLPRLITYPQRSTLENFLGVMNYSLRRAARGVIEATFRDSRLADRGLVDRDKLLAAYARARTGDEDAVDAILGTLMVELSIRSVEHHHASRSTVEARFRG